MSGQGLTAMKNVQRATLPALVVLLLLCLPAPASAAVTDFVREDKGVYYEYKYEELLESYVLRILGQPAALYDDYAAKKPVALKDDINGYVDYHNVVEAYALSIITGQPFTMNDYTASEQALKKELPPSIIKVATSGDKLTKTEEILLANPAANTLTAVTPDQTETQQILTKIRWTASTNQSTGLRYAWYIYKDGNHIASRWYTEENYLDYIPTQAGKYSIRAWAILEDEYQELTSPEIEVTSPVIIRRSALAWRYPLEPFTEPVVKLVQHHMAHSTWNIFDVHKFHLTRTYTKDDGTLDFWTGLGYNYWISVDGTIYEGRGRMQGGHAGPAWNVKSLGIGYQGDFQTQDMTEAQLKSGAWLNAILIVEDQLRITDVIGHRDIGKTTCPGHNFRMRELKTEILKLLPLEYQ